jgi:hypothetical protein
MSESANHNGACIRLWRGRSLRVMYTSIDQLYRRRRRSKIGDTYTPRVLRIFISKIPPRNRHDHDVNHFFVHRSTKQRAKPRHSIVLLSIFYSAAAGNRHLIAILFHLFVGMRNPDKNMAAEFQMFLAFDRRSSGQNPPIGSKSDSFYLAQSRETDMLSAADSFSSTTRPGTTSQSVR